LPAMIVALLTVRKVSGTQIAKTMISRAHT
jgi:hypothetical protein